MSLQIQEQNNAIIVPLEIKLDKLNELKEIVAELKRLSSELPEEVGGGEDLLAQDLLGAEKGKKGKSIVNEIAAASNDNQQVMRLMTDPQNAIIGMMSNPYVAAALAAAGLGAAMMNWLMIQGNILDRHFKRIITEERLAGIRRDQRRQTQIGLGRQVIITSHSGSNEPEYAFNSYEARRTGQIDSMNAFQIRRGYKF